MATYIRADFVLDLLGYDPFFADGEMDKKHAQQLRAAKKNLTAAGIPEVAATIRAHSAITQQMLRAEIEKGCGSPFTISN